MRAALPGDIDFTVNGNEAGDVTMKMRERLTQIQRGEVEDLPQRGSAPTKLGKPCGTDERDNQDDRVRGEDALPSPGGQEQTR